ncbi:hypothetical protein RJ639_028775 [Escallonia herrerae]|uniref:C3H1-type domain-containing protein n=1 Tax=Escallonia herrerae TaxID=1293975 RepID=A0AA88XK75_9ASTE|nr:hypothetical protein RJ639_028775 [Escallonia herrerae]
MGSICAEQYHKFHPSHQLYFSKKPFREIDIPPRKLLTRRAMPETADVYVESPRSEETLHQKYLPYNNQVDGDDDDDDGDPYSSDHFRMLEFKVRRCTRSRSHDWTDCPFAHPGEKARRRDPRRYHYSGTICSDFRRGSCARGENCEFAHGVFECWLHPARYRTEACKDGKNCKRKVCFFAHTPRQLRILDASSSPVNSPPPVEQKYRNTSHCCAYCNCVTDSPTSTLMGMSHLSPPMSPPLSPPLSPVKSRSMSWFSPISRFGDRLNRFGGGGGCNSGGGLSYKEALTELMSSLEAMNVDEGSSNGDMSWMDGSFGCDDQHQFVLSPSTPNVSAGNSFTRNPLTGNYSSRRTLLMDEKSNDSGFAGPDLGWVNDLLT